MIKFAIEDASLLSIQSGEILNTIKQKFILF